MSDFSEFSDITRRMYEAAAAARSTDTSAIIVIALSDERQRQAFFSSLDNLYTLELLEQVIELIKRDLVQEALVKH